MAVVRLARRNTKCSITARGTVSGGLGALRRGARAQTVRMVPVVQSIRRAPRVAQWQPNGAAALSDSAL